jgi:Rit1 N-terminal domain
MCGNGSVSAQQTAQQDAFLREDSSDAIYNDFESSVEQCLDFSTPLWKLPIVTNHSSPTAAQQPEPESAWDTSLHVPPWITHTERSLIEPQITKWAFEFLSTCQNSLPENLLALSKPLRPLWVSQSSSIWTNHVAPAHSLPFTPLYLVSASLPLLYHRKVTRVPRDVSVTAKDELEEHDDEYEEMRYERDTNETVSYVYVSLPLSSTVSRTYWYGQGPKFLNR